MLVARRPMSIGSEVFNTGDRITRSAQNSLPAGRMPQLIAHGWIEELVDEIAIERRVEYLEQTVDDLRAQIVRLSTNAPRAARKRQAKTQDDGGDEEGGDQAIPESPPEAAPEIDPQVEPEEEDEVPEPSPAEPEPEVPAEVPEEVPAAEPVGEAPSKIWDPIDACWKSEEELIAATEARTKRRRTKAVK